MDSLREMTLLDNHTIRFPYEYYQRMRAEEPVHFDQKAQAWLVTRYDDIQQAVRMTDALSNELGFAEAVRAEWQDEVDEMMRREGFGPHVISDNFQVDPPKHARRRGLVDQAFSAHSVARMEGDISAIARELMDRFIDRGEADIVRDYTIPFAIYVISDLLAVPRERYLDVKRWSDALVASIGRSITREQHFAYARDIIDLHRFVKAQLEDRRVNRGEDLISGLVHARIDDPVNPALSDAELLSIFGAILSAGNETTRNAMSWGIMTLAQNPQLMQELRDSPEQSRLLHRFVEEVLRIEPPVPQLPRVAIRDCEVGGVRIPKGSHVWLCFASANRDEAKFVDADRFDAQRKNAGQHLTFGAGIHRCIGAMLARMEMKCCFREIVMRMDRLELAAPDAEPDIWSSFVFRGLDSLPVLFTRRG